MEQVISKNSWCVKIIILMYNIFVSSKLSLYKLNIKTPWHLHFVRVAWKAPTCIRSFLGEARGSHRIVLIFHGRGIAGTGVHPCCSRSPNIFRPRSTHSNVMSIPGCVCRGGVGITGFSNMHV